MFTAKDQTGKIIVVTRGNVELLKKQRAQYTCSCCEERVILKAGEINLPHFSHLASSKCKFASEGESERHMNGKKYFLEWLILQDHQTDVEVYLSQIKRQADIIVDARTVIEYQCSTVPVKELHQRTEDYLMAGLCVYWILGQNIRAVKGRYYLTAFQQAFIKKDPNLGYYLMQYLPENNRWTMLYHITMDTTNRFYARTMIFEGRVSVKAIKQAIHRVKYASFYVKRDVAFERQKQCYFYTRFKKHSLFLKDLYEGGYNLQYLPMEIGVVLPMQFRVKTPALEWQFYLWNSFLRMLDCDDSFEVGRIQKIFEKHVILMPLIWDEHRAELCLEYLQFLCKQGVLRADGVDRYVMVRQMKEVVNKEVRFLDI